LCQQKIALQAEDFRLDIAFAGIGNQLRRLIQDGEPFAVPATGGQRLRQQDHVTSALEPSASRAISCQRGTDVGHSFVARIYHRPRRSLHYSTHRDDHGKSALFRQGDRRPSALFHHWPVAAEGMEDAVPVKPANARIAVLETLADRERLVAQQ
jgi:hypothetical protein